VSNSPQEIAVKAAEIEVHQYSLTELSAVLQTNFQVPQLTITFLHRLSLNRILTPNSLTPNIPSSCSRPLFQSGLSGSEASRKLARDGRNELTPPPQTPW
jgi:hypothetical protein